jgi:hypothetical protein
VRSLGASANGANLVEQLLEDPSYPARREGSTAAGVWVNDVAVARSNP